MNNVSGLKLEHANIEDCENIIDLQRIAYQREAMLYKDWTIPPLTQTVEELKNEFLSSIILKATIDEKIVGSVRAKLVNNVSHIGRLIVHPDFQKRGIGTVLLKKIEEVFTHVKSYELFTGSKSEYNIQFYVAHNYKISHQTGLSDRVTLVYLSKSP